MGCTLSSPQHRVSDTFSGEYEMRVCIAAIRRIIHDPSIGYSSEIENQLVHHLDKMMVLASTRRFSEKIFLDLSNLIENLYFRFPISNLRLNVKCSGILQQLHQNMVLPNILDQSIRLSSKEKTGHSSQNTKSDLRGTMCTSEIKDIVVQGYLRQLPIRQGEFTPLRHRPNSSKFSDDNGYGFYDSLED